jgi:single-strand DNA-binding protein
MNKVILLGRLTKDPEVRYTQSAEPTAVAKFTLAVNRRFKKEGEPDADFINCVSFGKQGEFVEKYLKKSMQIGVTGRINVHSFDDSTGQRRWVTEVITEDVEFAESRSAYEARMNAGGGDNYERQPHPYQNTQSYQNTPHYQNAPPYQNAQPFQNAPPGQGAPVYQSAPPYQGASSYQNPPPYQGAPPAQSSPLPPAKPQPAFEPEGFAAITESIDDDDLPF